MRMNRYIVDFGERPIFRDGKILGFYRCAEVCDAPGKREVMKSVRCSKSQIVFMRSLGN